MGINFKYTSSMNLSTVQSVLNKMKSFKDIVENEGANAIDTGTVTIDTNTQLSGKNNTYTETVIGTTLQSSTYTINKWITTNNITKQSITYEGVSKFKIVNGVETTITDYITKITYSVPVNGKTFTVVQSATKIPWDNSINVIQNFNYKISDGSGGEISFSIPSLSVSLYESLNYLTLKQQIATFSTSTYLSSNDNISIGKYGELFVDSKGVLNGYAGNDTLTGSLKGDIINGGTGADTMLGGAGYDTYYVDNVGDKVTELLNQGIDKVNSSISYILTANVENLSLIGTSAINGTGNTLNNVISGNSAANILNGSVGNDILNGGLGNDTLIGGSGTDIFVFNTAMNSITNVDKIKDFSVVDDTIKLENGIFTKLTTLGTLNKDYFKANTDGLAKDSNDYLVYETDTSKLFYDADGSGVGKAIQIALIENKAALTYADFTVI